MKERIIERTVNGIKVTSHIPEDVSESFKRNRINQIYDILVAADKQLLCNPIINDLTVSCHCSRINRF